MAMRNELVAVTAERYVRATRQERGLILDDFVVVTGFLRKHATRLLRVRPQGQPAGPEPKRRVYDDAVYEALIIIWGSAHAPNRTGFVASGCGRWCRCWWM
jgi:hypothetical protein